MHKEVALLTVYRGRSNMYAFIKGKLSHSTPSQATVETQGIGYLISIPASVFTRLPPIGHEVQFYTSLVVRENGQSLYGFLTSYDRDCFETLLGVTGIGPKIALNIIGHLAIQDLHTAVVTGDIPSLCKIPGIGRKTAERLLIEMRDKIPAMASDLPTTKGTPRDLRSQTIRDAMSALINLGYSQSTAQRAIKHGLKELPEAIDLSGLISAALKNV